MNEDRTTVAIQRFLNELGNAQCDCRTEPIVAALLGRAVHRLEGLCGHLLFSSYRRLTRPPLNLRPEEILSLVVERLLKAMREYRPQNVRQFFALANQHMRWELNGLARRLDKQSPMVELRDSFAGKSPASDVAQPSKETTKILEAIESLPEEEREVFSLIRIQGMTQHEVAEVIGMSAKTVQRRLNRSLILLAEKLRNLVPSSVPPEMP